jgi:hypothetical protein
MAPLPYSIPDIARAYHWLAHKPHYTEICILHPAYQHGDKHWNRRHDAWPRTHYITNTNQLIYLVRSFAGKRLVCYGINPRPTVLRHENGRIRSAQETDITTSQTLLLDLDLHGTITPAREQSLQELLGNVGEYCTSLGITPPTRATTGRGVHLLFAYPPINVTDYSDIRGQLRTFREQLISELRNDLDHLEARIDETTDLRRMSRVYGTSKPDIGIISRFHGSNRVLDQALQDYLLSLPAAARAPPSASKPLLVIGDKLPGWFTTLLQHDKRLQDLWYGRGKPAGTDHSRTGYDFSLIRCLMRCGIASPDELATILALRPTNRDKPQAYLCRTTLKALGRQP